MDNDIKSVAEENPLAAILGDPQLLSRLSGVIESLKKETPLESATTPKDIPTSTDPPSAPTSTAPLSAPTADALSSVLSNPELMAKLPDIMTALTPVLKGQSYPKPSTDKRTALLLALRPYLSEGRCEAIDYITRIGKLGDVVKNLKL